MRRSTFLISCLTFGYAFLYLPIVLLVVWSFNGSRIDITLVRHGRMVMPTPDIDIDGDQADDFGALADDTGQTP